MRVLLLGGTGEARALAGALHPEVSLTSSLAGRVADPALPVGPVRIGGFGGVDGLRRWLLDTGCDAVVDATHPFAATITAHAAQVCAELGVPYLVLRRPAWDSTGAITAASNTDAATIVAHQGYSRVFLTTGRSGIAPFRRSAAYFVIRVVTEPDPAVLPLRHRVVVSRGPYRYDDEYALLREHRPEVLVTKNSGGAMTAPKLAAARALGVEVVMVERPALPAGVLSVASVAEAAAWVRARRR